MQPVITAHAICTAHLPAAVERTKALRVTIKRAMQEAAEDLSTNEHVSRLHDMLRPHLLRRVKRDVLTQLPPKREQIVRVELSQKQKEYYKSILVKKFPTLANRGGGGGTGALTNVMMELRKCCNHPALFDDDLDASVDAMDADELVAVSGKLQLLDRMMPLFRERVRDAPSCFL
jgi:chromodomain-helicase-DNA-binding protein 4